LSERGEFLVQYAGRILGRDLTEDEAKLVSQETNRRVVRDLCATFSKPKPKPKAKAKKDDKPIKEVIEEVVKDEE
jgi:hypothetical protein